MSTFTILTALAFILLIAVLAFFGRKRLIKNKQLRLRVLRGRRSFIGLSIHNAEKKLISYSDLSMDIISVKKDIENSQNMFLMRNKNLLNLAELTKLIDLKASLLEKHVVDLRKTSTTTQVTKNLTTNTTVVPKKDLESKTLSPEKQRKTIEEELLDKINKLNNRD
ncbi:MAG: hypothetical protein VX294_14865 [Candidatus Latescibacterota bacterium]|nr:hypothetical protein [Candidatus Latescibacterota bacterium]